MQWPSNELAGDGLSTLLEESRVLPRFIQDGHMVKVHILLSFPLLFYTNPPSKTRTSLDFSSNPYIPEKLMDPAGLGQDSPSLLGCVVAWAGN